LIGVISKTFERKIVQEFFELFKTPWEFYHENRHYDVVLSTGDYLSNIETELLLIYSSNKTLYDSEGNIAIRSNKKGAILEYGDWDLPLYNKALTLLNSSNTLIRIKGSDESVVISGGAKKNEKVKKIFRIGYDLFQEIYFLLSSGQPAEYARIPTLEIHISILRNLILTSGIPLVEIPPIPSGYNFITCLTHDVDFAGIRFHRFDRTMFGFIYRALFDSFIGVLRGRTSWNKLLKNWKAVFLLPLVYLGFVKDFFNQFDRYIEIEKGLGSTFYVIPYKNKDGQDISGQNIRGRAVPYGVSDIEPELQKLVESGCEIGLHGIDAWIDSERGRKEYEQISSIVSRTNIGIRIHWLFFNGQSPKKMEKAGFFYDSTLGYNDAIGYRSGTTQVFRNPDATRLFELPLNIQDTALFYPKRMNLVELKAIELTRDIVRTVTQFGGVLTVNWHQRSLGPERLWGDFYIKLLEDIKANNVWFAKAGDAVRWFHKRRGIFFEETNFTSNRIKLKLSGNTSDYGPGLLLRIHRPSRSERNGSFSEHCGGTHFDVPLEDEIELKISF
jgi:hypothetical protein